MAQVQRTRGSFAMGVFGALLLLLIGLMPVAAEEVNETTKVQLRAVPQTGVVGQPLAVRVETPQEPLLSGIMYTVTTQVLEAPPEATPNIVTGVPVTTIICDTPGNYRIRLRVNKVQKTTCAGACFETVLVEELALQIE